MENSNIKVRENRVRRQLARQGCRLHKSRTDGCVQGIRLNDRGGYMIVDAHTNMILAGERFDLSLEDVEQLAAED